MQKWNHHDVLQEQVSRYITSGYLAYYNNTESTHWESRFSPRKGGVLTVDGRPLHRPKTWDRGFEVDPQGVRELEHLDCETAGQVPLQGLSVLIRHYGDGTGGEEGFRDVFEVPHRIRTIM